MTLAELPPYFLGLLAGRGGAISPNLVLFPFLVLLESLYLAFAALAVGCRVLRLRRLGGDSCSSLQSFWRVRPVASAMPEGCDGLPLLSALPMVSCIVTCYGEGRLVTRTLSSLLEQDYAGSIEVLAVVDGAVQNFTTWGAAMDMTAAQAGASFPSRALRVIPKWVRGGRASTLNAGLVLARGQIVLALDGDTSFDHDMVARAVRYFREPGVVALAGTLRVRNEGENLLTRLQALDYAIYRQFVRAGLGELNILNNIPGAHGAFRREVLLMAGGWDNGSAEDVDMSLRLRKCLGRHPGWRLRAAPDVIGHTDVPARWGDFFRQRLRWEGDPFYLFMRKHGSSLRPRCMGWRNWIYAMWYGPVFQMLMPVTMLLGLGLMLGDPARVAVQVSLAGYGAFFVIAALVLALHLALISERPGRDARLAWLLPLYPGFIFALRAWSGVAVLHSALMRSHRDSSMAPWWVLRKGRY